MVCEPRHATWFTAAADALLAGLRIARAAADPPVGTAPFAPGGWQGLHYYRLHGAPHIYYSEYDAAFLQRLAQTLSERSGACWCIFDNTARGAATTNAVCCTARSRGFKPREVRRAAIGGQGSRVSPLPRMQTGLSPRLTRGAMPT